MLRFGDLKSKFSKANVRSKLSNFKIGCRQNFGKIKKLILFGPNCPHLGIWTQYFQKPLSDFKAIPSKGRTCEILLGLES